MMLKDGFFIQNEITSDNILRLSEEHSLYCERMICEISDIAREAALAVNELFYDDGMTIYEIFEILAQGVLLSESSLHNGVLPENENRIASYFSSLSVHDKAVFSEMLCEEVKKYGINITEGDFLQDGKGNESVVYVKNRLAEEAYDVFSQELTSPTVSYVHSFKEAARAVAEENAEYCILPLEERGGARLSGISAILFAEDLKINSVTPVFGLDGSADMKYALVSKHFTLAQIDSGDDRYLEVQLRADSVLPLSAIFTASDSLGVSVYRVNTVTFETEEGPLPYYSVVFKNTERDFSSLLVFLTMFAGAYNPVGIYKNLE